MNTNTSSEVESIVAAIESLTVSQANELAKILEEKSGFSIAQMMSAGANTGSSAPSESETDNKKKKFKITVKAGSKNKIAAIKKVRTINKSLGIKEAKDLVESGGVLIDDMDEKQCDECKQSLGDDVEYEVSAI